MTNNSVEMDRPQAAHMGFLAVSTSLGVIVLRAEFSSPYSLAG